MISKKIDKEKFYKWKGPFVINTKISDRIYKIQNGPQDTPIIANHDRLKPAMARSKINTSWVAKLEKRKPATLPPHDAEIILDQSGHNNENCPSEEANPKVKKNSGTGIE